MTTADGDSPPLDYEVFEFEGLIPEHFTDVVLSNTERQQLRPLAEPGGPLHRIMSGLLSYKTYLEQGLGIVDLFAADGMAKAASIQAEIRAVKWQYEMWQRHLTFMPPRDEDQTDV